MKTAKISQFERKFSILYVDVDSKRKSDLKQNRAILEKLFEYRHGKFIECETMHGFHYKLYPASPLTFLEAVKLYLWLKGVDKLYIYNWIKGKGRVLFSYRRGRENYLNYNIYYF